MKMKKIFSIVLMSLTLMLSLPLFVRADWKLNIDIKIKQSFGVGEQVVFTYTLTSNKNQSIVYAPYITCPNAPIPLVKEKRVRLKEDIPLQDTYYGIQITEDIEPQTCTAYLQIISPVQQKEKKQFKIAAKPSFDFHIFGCKNLDCKKRVMVYQLGKSFYLGYVADVEEPKISATLTKPDGTKRKVNLGKPILLSKKGVYRLEAKASKDGYKTMTDMVEIGVVKEFVAPIDLREGRKVSKGGKVSTRKRIYYILGGLGILIVISTVIFFYYHRKSYY